jgi:hypothetical protein
VIDGREKLSEVKSNHASLELGTPSCPDNMSEEATSILGGVLTSTLELVGVEDSVFSCFKLQPIGEHFLKHLAWSVQENNQAKQLGSVIQQFSRLWYNHRSRGLEFSGPMAGLKAGVCQP